MIKGGQGGKIKEKDCVFGCSLKIGFRPIWPCGWRQAEQRESGRQIIWSSNPGLSTDFLCPRYPQEQNDTSMGGGVHKREGVGMKKRRSG